MTHEQAYAAALEAFEARLKRNFHGVEPIFEAIVANFKEAVEAYRRARDETD